MNKVKKMNRKMFWLYQNSNPLLLVDSSIKFKSLFTII